MKIILFIFITVFVFLTVGFVGADGVHFDFETTTQDWRIPDWAYYQEDHRAETVEVSKKRASHGNNSLEMICDFPGDMWTAALVEREKDMDLSDYKTISADVYLPKQAPGGILKARIILTAGDGWYFTEMRHTAILIPGKWTTIKARLESEEQENSDWKGRGDKRLFKNIHNVRKIAIRVEYDASPPHSIGPRYHGSIYVDNVVIE
ncbi:MAG: hypothetical protein ABID83_04315 [Candidatus Omnitrophota bacterium]